MGFEIKKGVLLSYKEEPGVTEIVIPKRVRKIGASAFSDCMQLEAVTIPDSVTVIGLWAFADCRGLRSITIPDSVTEIEEFAFQHCEGLTSVTIPDSITEINGRAFQGCTGLTSVTIPDSVTRIGESAFEYCRNLTAVKIPDSVEKISERAFRGCGYVIWKGFRLVEVPGVEEASLSEILSMVQEKNYTVEMGYRVKYQNLWMQFCEDPDEETLFAYIEEHFTEMFQFAIERNNIDVVEAVCKQGKLLTAENIDGFLEYVIGHQQTDIQLLLVNYKYEHTGYAENPFQL